MNEERFSPWQESEDNEETPVRSRFESVVDFLSKSREKSDTEADDNDEEKGLRHKKAKSSPWRRFMRGLFGGEKEEEGLKDMPSRTPRLISFEPIKEVTADANPLKAVESKNQSESVKRTGDDSFEQQELPVVSQPRNEEEPTPAEEHQRLEYEQTPVRQKPVVEQAPPESSHETNSSDQKHSNPTGLLLGLDYLNYRGRKKLEKKIEKQQKEESKSLNNLKERLRRQEEKQNRPSRQESDSTPGGRVFEARQEEAAISKQPEVQVVFNHQETGSSTDELDTNKIKQEKRRAQEELQELIELRRKQEEQRKAAREQSIEREKLERHKQNIDNQEKLSKELFEIESTFVEKEYERKNEVRDQARRLKPATSVGAVLGGMQVKDYSPSVDKKETEAYITTQNSKDVQDGTNQLTDFEISNMYKYAIKTGFTTALIFVAVILTIAILR